MKECKDCGKKYDESLDSCPRCGSLRTVDEVIAIEEDDTEVSGFVPNYEAVDSINEVERELEEKMQEQAEEESKHKVKKEKQKAEKPAKTEKKAKRTEEVIINDTDKAKANKILSKTKIKEDKKAAKQAKMQKEVSETTSKIFTKQFWIGLGVGFGLGAILEFAILYATEIIKFY